MNLINRYIAEVGRHLPEKDRADIEAEIHSMIEDMLEERGQPLKSANEKSIAETLEELGDPKLLARKYSPAKRYLIGPDWYDVYLTTLKRVLSTALPIVAIVAFVLVFTKNPLDFGGAFGKALGNVMDVGTGILFWVTAAFVIVEHSGADVKEMRTSKPKAWTVAQLPKTPLKRQISIGETLTNIVMELFALVWIVLPPMQAWLQGEKNYVPFLHPNLWNLWMPIFFVLFVLTLIHEVFKLKIGNWTPALTVTNVILGTASIIYIVALVTTQQLINPAFLATLSSEQVSKLGNVTTWSMWTVNLTAAVLVGIYIWDMLDSIVKSRRLAK